MPAGPGRWSPRSSRTRSFESSRRRLRFREWVPSGRAALRSVPGGLRSTTGTGFAGVPFHPSGALGRIAGRRGGVRSCGLRERTNPRRGSNEERAIPGRGDGVPVPGSGHRGARVRRGDRELAAVPLQPVAHRLQPVRDHDQPEQRAEPVPRVAGTAGGHRELLLARGGGRGRLHRIVRRPPVGVPGDRVRAVPVHDAAVAVDERRPDPVLAHGGERRGLRGVADVPELERRQAERVLGGGLRQAGRARRCGKVSPAPSRSSSPRRRWPVAPVFIGSFDHRLYAFPAAGCGQATCQPLWTGLTGGTIESSPTVGGGMVFIGSDDGKLYAFRASGCGQSTCQPAWTASLGNPAFDSSRRSPAGWCSSARRTP
jgi:hypothetical protein